MLFGSRGPVEEVFASDELTEKAWENVGQGLGSYDSKRYGLGGRYCSRSQMSRKEPFRSVLFRVNSIAFLYIEKGSE